MVDSTTLYLPSFQERAVPDQQPSQERSARHIDTLKHCFIRLSIASHYIGNFRSRLNLALAGQFKPSCPPHSFHDEPDALDA